MARKQGLSSEAATSAWDSFGPSLTPIRALGLNLSSCSVKFFGSQCNERKLENTEDFRSGVDEDCNFAWYDGENEDNYMFDNMEGLVNEEEEGDDRVVQREGKRKRGSEYSANNDKWANQQLNRGVGRFSGLESQTQSEDEDEGKVSLVFHDKMPSFLEGKKVFLKKAEIVVPVRDPTSDMFKIGRKGSPLVREIHEKQAMKKCRQRFWELEGSRIGDVIGVKKRAKQVESDSCVVGEHGEVDFKRKDQFAPHLQKQKEGGDHERLNIAHQRHCLPIFSKRDELMQIIRENQVVVVVGETGSGKTTQLAQYLHEEGYTKRGIVGCTQPRRVAAMSVAKRVSEEMESPLGEKVGYAIRFEHMTGPNTIIKYMTEGVLLREILEDPDLENYSAIIMDEAHERSLNTDVLFGIMKKVVARRRDLKLIVTSATLNVEKFSNFFGVGKPFKIPGRTFDVKVLHRECPCEDYVEAAVKQAMKIHITSGSGDMLIFLTGQEEIEAACHAFSERMEQLISSSKQDVPKLLILPMYSQLPADLQAKIFDKAEDGTRKCIIATNIAETSLTVDGISFVIDAGYSKVKVYNPSLGMDTLQVYPISQAASEQRSGRAGRTRPGICYRLYTENAYKNEMICSPVPEIQRTNLDYVVLLLKSLKIENLQDFEFMDSPPEDNINSSMYQLWFLGALDNVGNITDLGRKMLEFPLDPRLSKMLIMSEKHGCIKEILTIVSMLSVPSVFFTPKDRAEASDAAREKFFVPESDHLTLLNVYQQWEANRYSGKWCNEHFLHLKVLQKARDVRSQLLHILNTLKIQLNLKVADWGNVRRTVCSAYFHNAARFRGIGEFHNMSTLEGNVKYVNCRSGMPCNVHPRSALCHLGDPPEYMVYHELLLTKTESIHCVTAVEPQWLTEFGPMFFTMKESGRSKLEHKKRRNKEIRAMEDDVLKMRKVQAEMDTGHRDKDRKNRAKQQQQVLVPGLRQGASTRPKV